MLRGIEARAGRLGLVLGAARLLDAVARRRG